MNARDPCYRFDLDGWCRRGALCPFRHGPFSRLSELRPEVTRSEQSTSGKSGGVVSVLPCVQGLCGEGFRSHDDGVSLSCLTVGFGESEEASVAKVLRKELQRRARGQPLPVEEVELCADEYVYDEDALKQALTSASQSSSSCSHPRWRSRLGSFVAAALSRKIEGLSRWSGRAGGTGYF